jgi:hypothetical protein
MDEDTIKIFAAMGKDEGSAGAEIPETTGQGSEKDAGIARAAGLFAPSPRDLREGQGPGVKEGDCDEAMSEDTKPDSSCGREEPDDSPSTPMSQIMKQEDSLLIVPSAPRKGRLARINPEELAFARNLSRRLDFYEATSSIRDVEDE